ncbi:MAG: hypothetical protein KR126chlam2_00060 [Chlamydiae bacterium]|nr:hypothetical protein [Chlamydiota bacterium]
MALQAFGNKVGNALVPKIEYLGDYEVKEETRVLSVGVIAVGAIFATLGIVSLAFASSGVLPAKLFGAGATVATAMKSSIILTAVGGGIMAEPCFINGIASGVKKIKEKDQDLVTSPKNQAWFKRSLEIKRETATDYGCGSDSE